MIPGKIQNKVTLKKAFMGVHPKSFAAYLRYGSKLQSFGKTESTTYGIHIVVWAITRVKSPIFKNLNVLNKNINKTIKEIPVIISGLIKVILFRYISIFLKYFLDLKIPIAAIVPIIVANKDATMATKNVFNSELKIALLPNKLTYHFRENPENTHLLLELLNENITKTRIGEYKNKNNKKKHNLLNVVNSKKPH